MIRKGYDIHEWFFIGVSTSDYLDRLVHQCTLAIDLDLIFGHFADLSDLPFKWLGSWQGSVIALNRRNGYTMVIASYPSNTDLCQFIPDFQRIVLGNEDLKFHIRKIFHSMAPHISFHCIG